MAAFYESLFAGQSVGEAVTAGRGRLFEHDTRPSPKGDMPLADWLVPVHYLRHEVRFPDARTSRPAARPSLDEALDQIRAAPPEAPAAQGLEAEQDPLAPAAGVFVGRDDLFYELEVAARLQRVMVLTGPGGTGKTELAKGFARWWRDTGGMEDARLVFWHSFEPGLASFGLDGVIIPIGLDAIGTDFARLDSPERLAAVKELLGKSRCLLVWDNFESVREMADAAGATPPLEEAGCAQLWEFLDWVCDHSASTVIVTSRAREDWLGQVYRIAVGGLNRTEAAQYAGLLLAPFPAARERRERRSFGDLLDWLDGHPLAMRLTLPCLEHAEPAALLDGLRGTAPLPGTQDGAAEDAGPGRLSSLGTCIAYSYAHLAEPTSRLLPVLSLFHGTADAYVLGLFSAVKQVPARFAGTSTGEWTALLEDAARVGLLSWIGGGLYLIHPALPGYLAAAWRAGNPGGYDRERQESERVLRTACADFGLRLFEEIKSGDAAHAYTLIGLHRRTLGAVLGHALDHHAWDDAEGIVRALHAYWNAQGLSEEAAAWSNLILGAIPGSGQGSAEATDLLWVYTMGRQADWQRNAGQPDRAAQTYRQVLTCLEGQPETEWTRANIALVSHRLGMTAQDRGRLNEADNWYRKSLIINEELGDRPGMAGIYHQLGMTAENRNV